MKKTAILMLLLLVTSSCYPMGYARRAFSSFCTATHWILTLSTPLIVIPSLITRKVLEKKEYSSVDGMAIQDFAHKELKSIGLPHTKVIPWPLPTTCAGYQHIFIPYNDFQRVQNALTNNVLNGLGLFTIEQFNSNENEIDKFRGILHHEANHIKHQDLSLRLPLAALAVPLATQGAIKAARIGFGLAARTKKWQNTKKIASGWLKGFINFQGFAAISRLIEQQADDAMPHDSKILRGCIEYLKQTDRKNREALQEHPFILKLYQQYPYLIAPTHPTVSKRVQRFEERIAAIEMSKK